MKGLIFINISNDISEVILSVVDFEHVKDVLTGYCNHLEDLENVIKQQFGGKKQRNANLILLNEKKEEISCLLKKLDENSSNKNS